MEQKQQAYTVSAPTTAYFDALHLLDEIKTRLQEALPQTYGEDWKKRYNVLDFTDIEDYIREFLYDSIGNNVNALNSEL